MLYAKDHVQKKDNMGQRLKTVRLLIKISGVATLLGFLIRRTVRRLSPMPVSVIVENTRRPTGIRLDGLQATFQTIGSNKWIIKGKARPYIIRHYFLFFIPLESGEIYINIQLDFNTRPSIAFPYRIGPL